MDLIAALPVIGPFLSVVLPFIVVLGIVVFVHEYGHYIVGRWCGIKADIFSMGFGPVLWRRTDRRGTVWQVAALPLGGYVKFAGDADGSSRADPDALEQLSPEERAASFHGASVGRRALTVLAGPVFNFILAAIVFAGLILVQGVAKPGIVVGEIVALPGQVNELQVGDEIVAAEGTDVADYTELLTIVDGMAEAGPMDLTVRRDGDLVDVTAPYLLPPIVYGVEPLSPASRAGLEPGDVILSAGGTDLVRFEDLRQIVMASEGAPLGLRVDRAGETLDLTIAPELRDTGDGEGGFEKRVMIGVSGGLAFAPATERPNPLRALGLGVERVWLVITSSLTGLKAMITGDLGPENLQGPIGIAQISGETASQGLLSFINLIAVLSTAIGLLNLFPVPVLDGGHLVMFAYEAIRGKPASDRWLQVAMSIGLAMVLLLMLFATYNDIMRL
ncbi:RIP metalloprotease RseP [Oceanomicrobium pacificus]|uniref:Zinc metalloprotease n=1 Tax=Oceanomicrobium pacificus TaxID=2692916 RepID=A0A6B0U4G5_9RHOB|nr:RIP metalloprotease RseP [Oceanomicrobium pacificus]MXU65831.1 RIP metalloprotease RseP [Oceanomicrobium pacificus]